MPAVTRLIVEEYAELDSDGQRGLWRLVDRPEGQNAAGDCDPGLMCYYINHTSKRMDRNPHLAKCDVECG